MGHMLIYIEDLRAMQLKNNLEDMRRRTPEDGAHLAAGQGSRPGG
jgi:hypothetical protein